MLIRIFEVPAVLQCAELKERILKTVLVWDFGPPASTAVSFSPVVASDQARLRILITGISHAEHRYYRLLVDAVGWGCLAYAAERGSPLPGYENPQTALPVNNTLAPA